MQRTQQRNAITCINIIFFQLWFILVQLARQGFVTRITFRNAYNIDVLLIFMYQYFTSIYKICKLNDEKIRTGYFYNETHTFTTTKWFEIKYNYFKIVRLQHILKKECTIQPKMELLMDHSKQLGDCQTTTMDKNSNGLPIYHPPKY